MKIGRMTLHIAQCGHLELALLLVVDGEVEELIGGRLGIVAVRPHAVEDHIPHRNDALDSAAIAGVHPARHRQTHIGELLVGEIRSVVTEVTGRFAEEEFEATRRRVGDRIQAHSRRVLSGQQCLSKGVKGGLSRNNPALEGRDRLPEVAQKALHRAAILRPHPNPSKMKRVLRVLVGPGIRGKAGGIRDVGKLPKEILIGQF